MINRLMKIIAIKCCSLCISVADKTYLPYLVILGGIVKVYRETSSGGL